MINKLRDGDVIQHTAASAISSGDPVVIGNRVGIAIADIANGDVGAVDMEGCFSVPKVSAQAWLEGSEIFWDSSAELFTTVGTANTLAGHALKAADNPSSTGEIRLSPGYKKAAVLAALAQTISGTYSQSEVQAISTKVDAILSALKTAGLMANS
jgi:predicted RecA/RadA family phage recombinase